MTLAAGTSDEVVVRARGLGKTFRTGLGRRPVAAVVDATFEVRRGELFALLGPNGAGKTTTLAMLAGLVFPTAGQAELFSLAPAAAVAGGQLGYLPERPALDHHLTPEGVLDLAGRLSGLPRGPRRRRADELLARLALDGERARQVGRLSKGTQQRLALAQALIGSPPLLLLDEPGSGLDPIGHRITRELLAELRAAGTTIVLSTHLLAHVEATCDRVAIMVGGRVRRVGPPGALGARALGTAVVLRPGAGGPPAPPAGASAPVPGVEGTRFELPPGADVDGFVRAALLGGASLVSVTPRTESLEAVLVREATAAGARS